MTTLAVGVFVHSCIFVTDLAFLACSAGFITDPVAMQSSLVPVSEQSVNLIDMLNSIYIYNLPKFSGSNGHTVNGALL